MTLTSRRWSLVSPVVEPTPPTDDCELACLPAIFIPAVESGSNLVELERKIEKKKKRKEKKGENL